MPYRNEPSVTYWNGCYYFRTWFLEECEQHHLFGVTDRYIGQVTGIRSPFQVGSRIYLDDAPYFKKARTHHRVCGPYEIISVDNLPINATQVHMVEGNIIIYREAYPEQGPWLNRSKVNREIDGINVRFRQIADEFDFFPNRFAIRHARRFGIRHIPHEQGDCWLCR